MPALRLLAALSLLATFIALAACSDTDAAVAPSPPMVSTLTPSHRDYRESQQFVGRIEALDDVVLRPRITGVIAARHFAEGDIVERGAPLFTLERDELEAAVRQAEADLAAAQADQAISRRLLERGRGLVAKAHISAAEFDQLEAAAARADALLQAADARLQAARINLSYTVIAAPFTGRISDATVSVGELVNASETRLATLVRSDPAHVTFHLDEEARARLLAAPDDMTGFSVTVVTRNGREHDHAGELTYADNRIDRDSGTLKVQALIPNPDYRLLPGEHVQVTVARRTTEHVLTVPQAAVLAGQQGDYLYLLQEDQRVRRAPVTVGPRLGTDVVVHGVAADARVIASGFHRLDDGAVVVVREAGHE